MAYLSKVKVGGTVYDIKDALSREALEKLLQAHSGLTTPFSDADLVTAVGSLAALGEAAWLGVTTTLRGENSASDEVFATEKAVASAVKGLGSALQFVGVIEKQSGETDQDALARAVTDPVAGDVAIVGNKEYIYDGTNWKEIGDESLWVPATRMIAGIDLDADIQKSELANALELGNFAYTSTVEANVASSTISGVTAGYTPEGTVSVGGFSYTSTAIESSSDYTPAGSITGTGELVTGGSITVTLQAAGATTAIGIERDDYTPAGSVTLSGTTTVLKSASLGAGAVNDGIQLSGTISKPNVTVTPVNDTVVKSITYTAPSLTITYSTAALTTTEVTTAIEGIIAAMDTTDTEMLVLSPATTTSFDAVGSFDGGSITHTWDAGSVAVNGTTSVLVSAEAELSATPTFTGDYIKLTTANEDVLPVGTSASFSGTKEDNLKVVSGWYTSQEIATAEFTPTKAANLGFEGTTATITVSGNYDKLSAATATFVGTAATLNMGDVVVPAQTITVSAPAHTFA